MPVALESNAFFWGIEYLATFCCGMCGGLAAVRKGYDIFAILVTTWLTALGGGIIRDLLLGISPPVGVSEQGFGDRRVARFCGCSGVPSRNQ